MATEDLATFAHGLADKAGAILRRYFRQGVSAQCKADGSPVTTADHEAEAEMRDLIRQHYPDHGIYGEETAREQPDARFQWVLDPIDGTQAFLAGYPTFTTLIALCDGGAPILGIIDQPILRERWVGKAGQSSAYNNQLARLSSRSAVQGVRLCTTSIDYFSAEEHAAFERVRARTRRVLHGGDAYAYAMLAAGNVDAVIDAGMKPYDFCALVPIIEGAGGIITDWAGKNISLASQGRVVAAGSSQLHATLLALLNDTHSDND